VGPLGTAITCQQTHPDSPLVLYSLVEMADKQKQVLPKIPRWPDLTVSQLRILELAIDLENSPSPSGQQDASILRNAVHMMSTTTQDNHSLVDQLNYMHEREESYVLKVKSLFAKVEASRELVELWGYSSPAGCSDVESINDFIPKFKQ
jgi:hypothetical protein